MFEKLLKFLLILTILGLMVGIPAREVSLAAPQATITVTALDDSSSGDCSLIEALKSAASNSSWDSCEAGTDETDTIIFSVSGTISLTDQLSVLSGGPLVIDGEGKITISGGDAVRIFNVGASGDLTLKNLTLEDGYGVAEGSYQGGGCIHNEGTLEVSNCTLISCSATKYGGAIYNDSTLYLHDSTLMNNNASSSGGGIYVDIYGSLTIDSSTLSDNIAGSSGGALYTSRPATINDSTISGNESRSSGGGIINFSTMEINDSTISGNSADAGGGIDNTGTLTMINSTVADNSVSGDGGGIYNDDTLTIIGGTLSGNSAVLNGGAIYNRVGGMVDISNSTLVDNNADFAGGGISSQDIVIMLNNTLSENHANLGGGVFNEIGSLTIDNCTFFGNSAVLNGGAIDNHGLASVEGTILAGTRSGGNCGGDPVFDDGFNLEDASTCGFLVANNSMANTDPMLAPLQDNGGASWTHALLTGSPAIDVADYTICPATDQRGVPRPLNGDWSGGATCDIGAYEVGMFIVPLSQEDTLSPGETGSYEFTLYNYTNITDTYTLTSEAGYWTTSVSPDELGSLPPGGSATFTLYVTPSLTAKVGGVRTAIAYVSSTAEPEVYGATAQVEITVGPFHFYLPMIARTE